MSYVGNKPAQTTIPVDDSVTTTMLQDDAVTSAKIDDGTITSTDMAVDPRNASNLNAGDVPLAQLGNAPATDVTGLEDDIALLGFKVASNGSLAKYNLVDQTVDDFQDTSGVDASASISAVRDASGKYYTGDTTPTGGTITSYTDSGTDYTVHSFESTGTFKNGGSGTLDIFVLAGGGGGGGLRGGGGGGGGFVTYAAQSVSAGTQTVTVGLGGSGGVSGGAQGTDGGDSQFASLTTSDGGGGGGYGASGATTAGRAGGSGGGSSQSGEFAGGSATAGQGYDGGQSAGGGASGYGGSGGGGAGAVGSGGSTSEQGGAGGNGANNNYRTGSNVTYGGGGGGSADSTTTARKGAGGSGGGGGGSNNDPSPTGSAGTDGLGGGGGGGSVSNDIAGYDGGNGLVVVRFVEDSMTAVGNLTLVSTTTAAQAAPTKGDIVLTYTNGAGTTTLDTDLTAEISADGGSTWTALALGSEGSTGAHNIATSHDVTISSTITSPWNMAYRIKAMSSVPKASQ